jgi:hypothetical protein
VGAFGSGHLRECKFKVAQADAAKAAEESVCDDGDAGSGDAGQAAWKDAKAVDEEPGKDEFKYVAKGGPGRWISRGLGFASQDNSLEQNRGRGSHFGLQWRVDVS